MERDETIKRIRAALKRRSGKQWSVTGGRGTAWGWINIDAPPARCRWKSRIKPGRNEWSAERDDWEEYDAGIPGQGYMSPDDRAELAKLLGLTTVHCQGVSIAASNDYWQEYIDRAEGRTPTKIAEPYWD